MTAGIRSQQIAGTTVALPRTALAGLMGVALLVGGVLGVATKSEFDSIAAHGATAQVAASSLESRQLTQRSQISVGRGPLVRDPGASGPRRQAPVHAADHIGLTERLFPVTSAHHLEHGPLR
jgi:hypothetical protein